MFVSSSECVRGRVEIFARQKKKKKTKRSKRVASSSFVRKIIRHDRGISANIYFIFFLFTVCRSRTDSATTFGRFVVFCCFRFFFFFALLPASKNRSHRRACTRLVASRKRMRCRSRRTCKQPTTATSSEDRAVGHMLISRFEKLE